MSHTGESIQKSTIIYRCSDDINNFKIRVNIQELREGLARNDETGAGRGEGETKVFLWQQKVYGKFEREFYKDPKNCVTELEKKYHEDVTNLIQSNDVLFTYVNEDEFCLTEESCVLSKTTTELCKQINSMRLANDKAEFFSNDSDGFDFKQSLIRSLNNPYGDCNNFDVMYIMADLGEYVGETWLKSEYILCTIKYDHVHKLLLVFPDFTNLEPYYIQINGDSKRTFQFHIQDASEKMPIDVLLQENEILNKVLSRQTKMRLQKTGTDFELPPKNKLNVHLFFEILTARNFEYKDIYVQYFIDLPEKWFCKDPSSLKGTTQTSHSCGDDNLSYFGFPFEVCLEYNIQELGKSSTLKAPYIYFEVISKDSWDRFRTEGLTYTILPISQPGVYRYDLHCLRICPKGPSGNLRRFFIGDCSSYDDITWISVPNDHDVRNVYVNNEFHQFLPETSVRINKASHKKVVNKYGIDTIGTGQISIRTNVIHQSQAFMADYIGGTSRKHEKFILEKLNLSTLVKSIEQVLEAFKTAKRKMMEARKAYNENVS